jgi:hypothetical protein
MFRSQEKYKIFLLTFVNYYYLKYHSFIQKKNKINYKIIIEVLFKFSLS